MGEIYGFLALGGPVMIPIALGSVVALAIFLERLWSLQAGTVLPAGLLERVEEAIGNGKPDEALAACRERPSPFGRIVEMALSRRDETREQIKARLEDQGRFEVARLDRYVEAVGTIAAIEPLLGLLGTVTGMIKVFQEVVATSEHGAIDPGRLANGIWEALITTAAGLIVAIPAFVAYRYLQSRAQRLTLRMEDGALRVVDGLKSGPHAAAGPS
ncbi:MAG: MotA/TolQ/ExbB proton channel family protein [Myxococcota bacterium]|nr:MotA/TolQ/ExbB proton channel family protein [Myxococcota bacterium]